MLTQPKMASKIPCPWDGCEKSYGSRSAVKAHYDTEHAGVRHTCDICGDTFKSKRARDSHNKSKHLNMKNWRKSEELKCPEPVCSGSTQTYATKAGLERHIRSKHSGKDFPCGECDLVFTNPEKLDYHVKHKHHGLRFTCLDCGDSFASKQLLFSHIKRSPLCVLRESKKEPPPPSERKRKLGEVDKTAASFFFENIADSLKNLSRRECLHGACTNERLSYGFRGGDKLYCIKHKDDKRGLVDLGALNLCVFKGCFKRGHNTVKNCNSHRFCATHRDMLISDGLPEAEVIFEKNTATCRVPGCPVTPSYDDRTYCRSHSPTGVSDDQRTCTMVCCKDGGPRPTYVHPESGNAICAFGARALMEDALLHNDNERSTRLMEHFGRTTMLVLNQQSAFRVCLEKIYWKMLSACSKVCFDESVSSKPKTSGDLRPDIFYIWEVDGNKMAIHIEYDECNGEHENNKERLDWIARVSGTTGRVYLIRVDANKLCTRTRKGSVVYYTVNHTGQLRAEQVAKAVIQKIQWIKAGLTPDDGAERPARIYM